MITDFIHAADRFIALIPMHTSFDGWATILTAFIAWTIFRYERSQRRKEAAKSILMNIDQITEGMEEIKKQANFWIQTKSVPVILPTLLQSNNWNNVSSFLADKFSYSDLQALNKFFEAALLLQKRLNLIADQTVLQMHELGLEIQRSFAREALQGIYQDEDSKNVEPLQPIKNQEEKKAELQKKIDNRLQRIYETDYWFFQYAAVRDLLLATTSSPQIKNTPIYSNLESLQDESFYVWKFWKL